MIQIALLEPEHEGNIGAIARAMANFDLENLVLINSKVDHLGQESRNRAKHAQNILKKAKILKSIKSVRTDYLIGTTAKLGRDYNIPRAAVNVEQLASKVNTKKKVTILFGREGQGLSNDEIKICDFVVTIPASKKYPTLNVSQAATILFYELFKRKKETSVSHITHASGTELKQINKMFIKVFNQLNFATKEKKETQNKTWKKIIAKSFMTKREAYAVMGLLKKLIKSK